jgi:hypothetical protein
MLVFENRVLMTKFGPEMKEITGKLRKEYNEELHKMSFAPDTAGELGGQVAYLE